jgi:ADP-ribose pyrophosphatase
MAGAVISMRHKIEKGEEGMGNLIIKREQVETLVDKKFVRLYDLQYAPGRHYYDASRRAADDLAAVKNEEEFRNMLPDAVSCIVIVELPGQQPCLLLSQEYRYPAGRFLLSVPAGLIDPEDVQAAKASGDKNSALLVTAAREIHEETGLVICEEDELSVVNPFLFSTPGMTDESNALVCAVLKRENLDELSQDGAEGSELFDGVTLVTPEHARKLLQSGRDDNGHFYSIFTWAALMYFCAISDAVTEK